MLFALLVYFKVVSKRFLRVKLQISDDYVVIAPPETPISPRYGLWASKRVCIIMSFPEG